MATTLAFLWTCHKVLNITNIFHSKDLCEKGITFSFSCRIKVHTTFLNPIKHTYQKLQTRLIKKNKIKIDPR